MKRLVILAAFTALTACDGAKPERSDQTSNPGVSVERLFTHEGCTVYRFCDGYNRYYVRCDDGRARAEWRENCGKGCTRPVEVETAP